MFAAADAGITASLSRLSKGGGGRRGRHIRLRAAYAAEDLHCGGPLFHSFFSNHQETASAYGSCSSSSSSNFLASVPLLTVRTYERTPENFRYGGDNVCRRFSLSLSLLAIPPPPAEAIRHCSDRPSVSWPLFPLLLLSYVRSMLGWVGGGGGGGGLRKPRFVREAREPRRRRFLPFELGLNEEEEEEAYLYLAAASSLRRPWEMSGK